MASNMDGWTNRGSRTNPPGRRIRPIRRVNLIGLWCALVVALMAGRYTALAQTVEANTSTATQPAGVSNANSSAMKPSIRPAETASERLLVPTGTSRVVDIDRPLKRASVAAPDIADVSVLSPRQVVITGRAVGSTQVVLWDEQDNRVVIEVAVALELSQLKSAIAQLAPNAKIEVTGVRDAVVLTGQVPDSDTADHIMQLASIISSRVQNQMTVAGSHQVLLRCTVAEVSKSAIRKLGVNGWLAGDNVRDVFMVNQLDGINPTNIGASPTGNIIEPKVGAFPSQSILFGTPPDSPAWPLLAPPTGPEFSIGFPRVQMQLFFRALRENRLLKVLAEPNLVALSGQEAKFLAGGEFPVPIPQGLGTTTIEWRRFGVLLSFRPTVIGRQMVRLTVQPEVSERDFTTQVDIQGTIIPGLKARSADTTIEMPSGSTIAIAGLLSEQVQAAARKIPGLGDVPVLGTLFSSVDYQKNLTELVILVTPELVSNMNPDQVASVPGQYMSTPNDWQLFGLQMIEGEPLADNSDPDKAMETEISPRYRKFTTPPEQMSLHGPWGQADEAEAMQ